MRLYWRTGFSAACFGLTLLVVCPLEVHAQDAGRRFEDFRSDPHWEGFRNHLRPERAPRTKQDFGWSPPGQIGGWIERSLTPAWFAKRIGTRTLNDRLKASGKFTVSRAEGASGALFGWFHETSRGWRTSNSLVFRLDGNGGKYWVFYEYGTRHWMTGGGGCFEGEQYQTTTTRPFPADGAVHTWSLDYDPAGGHGNGLITFVLDGTAYTCELAPGHQANGAEFNRFGLLNQQTTGSGLELYLRELMLDGQPLDLSNATDWEARGNKAEFEERHIRPFHDFGWRLRPQESTPLQSAARVEVGGIIWRDEKPAFYAAQLGLLSLEDELFASGEIVFNAAGSDSGAYLGWFNSNSKTNKYSSDHQEPQQNFLAILIEGPSQIGHYFRPAYRTAAGKGLIEPAGPIIRPDGQAHQWSLHYSPQPEGHGLIRLQLDQEAQTFTLRPEHRKTGASFDRFGLFNLQVGGHFVDLAVRDVTYTARPVRK